MTVEELLKPRYRIIKKYPGSEDWEEIGVVIELPDSRYKHCPETENGPDILCGEYHFDGYPSIYERLGWWEERTTEEMPKYVTDKRDGQVYKWGNQSKLTPSDLLTNKGWVSLYDMLPATEEEYKNQKK